MREVSVAVVQVAWTPDPEENVEKAAEMVRRAADRGAGGRRQDGRTLTGRCARCYIT